MMEGWFNGKPVVKHLSMVMGDSLASLEVLETKNRAEDHLRTETAQLRTRHQRLRATALRERLKDGSWIIRHLPGVKLEADFLTKIIAVKPSWERGSGGSSITKVLGHRGKKPDLWKHRPVTSL